MKNPKADAIQARRVVAEGFDAIWHGMDVSAADIKPDIGEWNALQNQVAALLLEAYRRNHN